MDDPPSQTQHSRKWDDFPVAFVAVVLWAIVLAGLGYVALGPIGIEIAMVILVVALVVLHGGMN